MTISVDELIEQYRSGLSVWKIGAANGISGQKVWAHLKKAGVSFRSREEAIRKEKIDLKAFSAPLSKSDCYWLGLLYADGSITVAKKTGFDVVSLTAHRDDVESIVGFLGHMGLTSPINWRRDKRAVSTAVTSKTISRRLRELGVVPNKTHTIRYPNFIPDGMDRHFVRGYFDGDGSVYFRSKKTYASKQGSIAFAGNPRFIADIADIIESNIGIRQTSVTNSGTGSDPTSCVQYRYEGRSRLVKICEWLYGDGGPVLTRKKHTMICGLRDSHRSWMPASPILTDSKIADDSDSTEHLMLLRNSRDAAVAPARESVRLGPESFRCVGVDDEGERLCALAAALDDPCRRPIGF